MGVTLSDGSTQVELIAQSFSVNLQSSVSQVKGYKSTWFTAKTPNAGAISISFLQGSINAQNATVGLLQRWLQQNALLDFNYPEAGFADWKTYIKTCPYQWKYDTPAPICSFTMDTVTNWYQTSTSALVGDSNVYGLFNGGIVSKDLNQIEGAGQSSSGQQNTSPNQAVAQWIKSKCQFNGIYVKYFKNGNVTVIFSNGLFYTNVKPTYSLYQQILNYQSNHSFQAKGSVPQLGKQYSAPQQTALKQLMKAKEYGGFEKATGDINRILNKWMPFL